MTRAPVTPGLAARSLSRRSVGLSTATLMPHQAKVSSTERRSRRPPDRDDGGRREPQEPTRVRIQSTVATLLLAGSFHKVFHKVARIGLRLSWAGVSPVQPRSFCADSLPGATD